MNQLAILIRNLNEGPIDLEGCHLTASEITALNSIGDLIRLSPADLSIHLSNEGGPTDWLINPFANLTTTATT